MGSQSVTDLWSEIVAAEEQNNPPVELPDPEIAIIYRRQKGSIVPSKDAASRQWRSSSSGNENLQILGQVKRVSWNRSLSTRGRTSIAAFAYVENQPQKRKARRNAKPPLPKGKAKQPPNFDKERAYFEEVDAFELLEESPSPKKSSTWTTGDETDTVIPYLSSVLRKWLISKKLNRAYVFPCSLSKVLETPTPSQDPAHHDNHSSSILKYLGKDSVEVRLSLNPTHSSLNSIQEKLDSSSEMLLEDSCEDIGIAVSKLSLTSRPSSVDDRHSSSFSALLTACGQTSPSTLADMLLSYWKQIKQLNGILQARMDCALHLFDVCAPGVVPNALTSASTTLNIPALDVDRENITKVGEGTYGEAFKVGNNVCKIVPFDGNLRVNGEVQKRSEELLEEVVLSCTLNRLRGYEGHVSNACTTFIKTIDLRVCQGLYDSALVSAWEDWDGKHGSENDHPKEFPENQCYVVFVQGHGGQDLESFVLLNFNEARSLLVQVTLGLAVAEAAYEFEHRDLHWGNILLSRKDSATLQYILEQRKIQVKTFGLLVSIIDFTLSRINTGEDILFLDLSSDPEIFEGPKGDKQADTYRKMRDVTDDFWEGSFPKTNVYWLQYMIDILLQKKSFDRSSKDERELRSLKKRLNNYGSAKEAVWDSFFSDLLTHES